MVNVPLASCYGRHIGKILTLDRWHAGPSAEVNENASLGYTVVPPVTSIRELVKKQEVKTKAHSNVQLAVPCLPVSFQSLLPTNEKLHAPTLPAVF